MNLGVDVFARDVTPKRYQPGIGLRPGEPVSPVQSLQPALFAALYDSIAGHSRAGLNVVADVGHHDRRILAGCAQRLDGLPALFVGVRCPIEVIMERRKAGQAGREGHYLTGSEADPIPGPVLLWQSQVHEPGIYDLEVDTSRLTPEECAAAIRRRLLEGGPPISFRQLAESRAEPREAIIAAMTRIAEITIVSRDVDAAARFYGSLLGEPAAAGHPTFDIGGVVLRILGPDAAQSGAPGDDHIALEVENVDGAVAELESQGLGIEHPPHDYYWGRSAYLRDPDGRLIELHQT